MGNEKKTPGQIGIWHGLSKGYDAFKKPDYDSNLNKGQRSEAEQEVWDEYSRYKHYAGEALKKGEITEEQFNYIKGKAGANTVMNHYVDRKKNPFLHGLANNGMNMYYQFKQSWDGDQPWLEAIKDYWQQDAGVEDTTPLSKPWKEIEYWKNINKKGPLSN